ncbi:MAG: hypothetical protein KatS3mg110_0569 [Pirellulaceae bacterium]|nr:MAG: hypothetical protein KatS3mg110_0569 [Pirellulaceae bacterium]
MGGPLSAWLAIVSGLASSAHCLGMCGPFVLMASSNKTGWNGYLLRPLLYSIGRLTAYAVLGAAAGLIGRRVSIDMGFGLLPAALGAVSGIFFVREGLALCGIWPHRAKHASNRGCGWLAVYGLARNAAGPAGPLLVGMLSALLPCALLYGMLALAASQASVLGAALMMLLFGLGTVPALLTLPWISSFAIRSCPHSGRFIMGTALTAAGLVALLRSAPILLAAAWPGSFVPVCCH